MNTLPKWRVMCFEKNGESLIKIIDIGELDLYAVRENISPNDEQEMCGSYRLDANKVQWLYRKVGNPELLSEGFEMFLERES